MVGCLGQFRLWDSGASFTAMVSVRVAPPRSANRDRGRKYHPSGIAPDCNGLRHLGGSWRGAVITVHCDNTGAVVVVNTGYSQTPQIMHLLRCLFFIMAYFDISLSAEHIPGKQNLWADAISRNNLDYFSVQVPGAESRQSIVPPQLVQLLVEQPPGAASTRRTNQ